jgi:hypothetical protein
MTANSATGTDWLRVFPPMAAIFVIAVAGISQRPDAFYAFIITAFFLLAFSTVRIDPQERRMTRALWSLIAAFAVFTAVLSLQLVVPFMALAIAGLLPAAYRGARKLGIL